MANPHNLKVGQEIFLDPRMNALHGYKDRKRPYEKRIISKIGNKFFEVKNSRSRFFNDTLAEDGRGYHSDWQGYLSEQDILDEKEYVELLC